MDYQTRDDWWRRGLSRWKRRMGKSVVYYHQSDPTAQDVRLVGCSNE